MATLGPAPGTAFSYRRAADRPPLPRSDRSSSDRRRWLAAVLLVVAVALSAVSLATPWWTFQSSWASTGNLPLTLVTNTLDFNVGTSPTCTTVAGSSSTSCTQGASAPNYDNDGLSSLGAYYLFAQVSAMLGLVLGSICALFMFLGAGHRLWGRWHFHLVHLLALCVGVLLILSPMLLVVFQPSLLTTANRSSLEYDLLYGPETSCGSNTPNTSYWDSCTYQTGGDTVTTSWGAGLGWYLALASAILFLLGGGIFLSSRDDPRDEFADTVPSVRRAIPRSAVGGLGVPSDEGPSPAYAVPLAYQDGPGSRDRSVCGRCGHANPGNSALCTRCHATLG